MIATVEYRGDEINRPSSHEPQFLKIEVSNYLMQSNAIFGQAIILHRLHDIRYRDNLAFAERKIRRKVIFCANDVVGVISVNEATEQRAR